MTSMNRSYVRPVQKRRKLDRLTLIVLAVFAVLAIITAFFAFKFVSNLVASWTMTNLPGVTIDNDPNQLPVPPEELPANQPMQPEAGPKPDPWDGKSRITILVLGLDFRDWEDQNEAPRSDTMILLTLDPLTKSAGMLSIPRDMWVDIPGGYGYSRINNAYRFGELDDLPGGGPALAMETVKEFLGVPINYYAQVDFSAFVRFIDEIEGVKVEVKEEMTLDPIGPAPKVHLEPGVYTLPGDLALAYARIRKLDGDDFSRSERQQEVIMAVRDRILDFNMLPTLVSKSPVLYKELSSGVRTNLTPEEIIKLAWLAIQIKKEDIQSGVIGPPDQVEFGTSPEGWAILIPVPDRIRLLRDEIFATAPVGPVAIQEDTKALAMEEAARVSVQNGTTTPGLAERTGEFLVEAGIDVVEKTNAAELFDVTTVYIYDGKPYTAQYITGLFGLENVRVYNKYDPNAQVDITVILGADWAVNNTMPN